MFWSTSTFFPPNVTTGSFNETTPPLFIRSESQTLVIGIIVGVIAGIPICVVICCCIRACFRRKRTNQKKAKLQALVKGNKLISLTQKDLFLRSQAKLVQQRRLESRLTSDLSSFDNESLPREMTPVEIFSSERDELEEPKQKKSKHVVIKDSSIELTIEREGKLNKRKKKDKKSKRKRRDTDPSETDVQEAVIDIIKSSDDKKKDKKKKNKKKRIDEDDTEVEKKPKKKKKKKYELE